MAHVTSFASSGGAVVADGQVPRGFGMSDDSGVVNGDESLTDTSKFGQAANAWDLSVTA